MTGAGWGVLVVVLALAVMTTALAAKVRSLSNRLDATTAALDELRRQTLPLLADTRSALRKADGASRKTDALIDVATSLTNTADSASRLAYKLVSNPLVKVIAFFTGTGRAAKRLAEITAPSSRTSRRLGRSSSAINELRRADRDPKALPYAPPIGPATPPANAPRGTSSVERHVRVRRNRSK